MWVWGVGSIPGATTPAQKKCGNDGGDHDITYHNHNENIHHVLVTPKRFDSLSDFSEADRPTTTLMMVHGAIEHRALGLMVDGGVFAVDL